MPCATQNEIQEEDAKKLVENGCKAVFEGANMPSTTKAIKHFQNNSVIFGPAKGIETKKKLNIHFIQNFKYFYK